MKLQTVALSYCIGLSFALPHLEPRQVQASASKLSRPFRYSEVAGTLRANSKHVTVTYGPFTIPGGKAGSVGGHDHSGPRVPGGTMDPNGYNLVGLVDDGICNDCTVLSAKTLVTRDDGTPLGIGNGVYLHHSILLMTQLRDKPSPFSAPSDSPPPKQARPPQAQFSNYFLVQASENFTTRYTAKDGSIDSGYYVDKGPFALQAELVNYKSEARDIYFTMDYEYVPGKLQGDTFITLLSVNDCMRGAGGCAFKIPANTRMTKVSPDFPVAVDGTIVSARGHMHDGGVAIKLYHNGQLYCDSKATYGGGEAVMIGADGKKWETISEMSECDKPLNVKKGDVVRIEATFDTVNHPLRESQGMDTDAMGIYAFSFVPG